VLQQTGAAIRHCLHRAGECERLAELAQDREGKAAYVRLAEIWRRLAESRDFTDKIDRFLGSQHDR